MSYPTLPYLTLPAYSTLGPTLYHILPYSEIVMPIINGSECHLLRRSYGWQLTCGLSIKYVKLLLTNFYPHTPCHKLSQFSDHLPLSTSHFRTRNLSIVQNLPTLLHNLHLQKVRGFFSDYRSQFTKAGVPLHAKMLAYARITVLQTLSK